MSKLIYPIFGVVFLVLPANITRARFANYRRVEAYEIRPGILIVPTYSPDGQVCEIGIEKLHYAPDKIRLDSTLSRTEIGQIFDELAPSDERGPQPKDPFMRGMTTFKGQGVASEDEYENVEIEIYGTATATGGAGIAADEVVATLKWKNQKCL